MCGIRPAKNDSIANKEEVRDNRCLCAYPVASERGIFNSFTDEPR